MAQQDQQTGNQNKNPQQKNRPDQNKPDSQRAAGQKSDQTTGKTGTQPQTGTTGTSAARDTAGMEKDEEEPRRSQSSDYMNYPPNRISQTK